MTATPRIVFAPQERVDLYAETARRFMLDVLDITTCFITDESRLSDFSMTGWPDGLDSSGTLPEVYDRWDAWVVPRICDLYKLEPFETNIYLVDLFELIEARQRQPVQ